MNKFAGRMNWRWGDAFLMRQSDATYDALMRRPARGALRMNQPGIKFLRQSLRRALKRPLRPRINVFTCVRRTARSGSQRGSALLRW